MTTKPKLADLKYKQSRTGFTLVELLIVIAILAILSTLGIGNFQSARIKARDIGRKSDLQTIAKSLEAYVNDHGNYPLSDSNGKIICKSGNTICDWGTPLVDDNDTVYVSRLPIDSSGSVYKYISNGTSYTLYAHLENNNDPSIATFNPTVTCGSTTILCNYKHTSSNLQ
ncbi:type II secretion system protein [Candidatus Woesebacteria bacterium]|nr:type II secretion system protein [Candidatus Woesebacteria bacterium]